MITEYIRYKLTSHSPEDLVSAYAKAADHLKAAPECHGFDLAQCQDEPNCLTLRILWTSTSGHLEGFRKGPHFPPFLALIRPFISEIDEMRHYSPTDVVWTRDGGRRRRRLERRLITSPSGLGSKRIKFEAMHWVADIIAALPILRLEACGSPRLECNGIGIGASASTGRDIGSRPPSYFAVPLAGCLVIALGTDALLNATSVQTLADAASLGLLIGMSYTATVTAVNSVTPTIPAPVIMASIVGFYHVVGITIVPIIVIISI